MLKIGLIRLSSLGDIILTEPVSRCLKEQIPEARISYFTRAFYRPVIEMFSEVDDIICFEIPGADEKMGDLKARLKDAPGHFDLIIDLHKNIRSRFITRNLKAAKKLTYSKNRLYRQMKVWTKNKQAAPHTIDRYLAVLSKLGLNPEQSIPHLRIPDESLRKAICFLTESHIESGRFAILAVGAAHPAKHYPLNQFAQLAELISKNHDLKTIVVEEEQFDYLNLFDGLKNQEKLAFAIGWDFKSLAALISLAKLTISNDSGIMHLSAASGAPTAGLFGPTHPVLGFSPLGPDCLALTTDEKCSPCSLHGEGLCYRDQQYCFLNLSPEIILDKIAPLVR